MGVGSRISHRRFRVNQFKFNQHVFDNELPSTTGDAIKGGLERAMVHGKNLLTSKKKKKFEKEKESHPSSINLAKKSGYSLLLLI